MSKRKQTLETGTEKPKGNSEGRKLQRKSESFGTRRLQTKSQDGLESRNSQRKPKDDSDSGNSQKKSKGGSLSALPVTKNEVVEAEIIGIGHDGEGVGRTKGFTLFIHGALPGERVRAKVTHVKKQYGYAKLLEIIGGSPDRVQAPCPIYHQCGGCQLQHLSYPAQLAWKRQSVVDALERIGKLRVTLQASEENILPSEQIDAQSAPLGTENVETGKQAELKTSTQKAAFHAADSGPSLQETGVVVHPTIGMDEPWRYRNKAQVPIGQVEGGLIGGFYAQGSHRIIDMDECLIQHEHNDLVVAKVKEIGRELGIEPYDEEAHAGLLRHVVVKVGFRTGDVMVVLVTNGEHIPRRNEWIERITAAVAGIKSICQSVNTGRTNVIFGDRTKVLWGEETIRDFIGDVEFAISARSFYQVNPVQTEVLYRKALEYAGLTGTETVIDAYCGIGTISLFLARHAQRVYGVEIVEDAIADARRNAELNDLRNVTFAVGKAEEVIPAWREQGVVPDVIVVDPPRKGCEPSLLETMAAMRPERIVYVSCNPATLARDLAILEQQGYRTLEVQPVDMFPHTVHVEAVCLLVRDETEG